MKYLGIFSSLFLLLSCAENVFHERSLTSQGQTLYEPRTPSTEGLTTFAVKGYALTPLKDLLQNQNSSCFYLEIQGNHDRVSAYLDQWKIELFEGPAPEWHPTKEAKGKELTWKTPTDPEITPPRGEMRPDYRGKSPYWSNQGVACVEGPVDLSKGVTLRVLPQKAGTFERSEFDLVWLPTVVGQEVSTKAASVSEGPQEKKEVLENSSSQDPKKSEDEDTISGRLKKRKQPYRDW